MRGYKKKKRSYEQEMEKVRKIFESSGKPLSFNQILRAYDEKTYRKMSDMRNHLKAALNQLMIQQEIEQEQREEQTIYHKR